MEEETLEVILKNFRELADDLKDKDIKVDLTNMRAPEAFEDPFGKVIGEGD